LTRVRCTLESIISPLLLKSWLAWRETSWYRGTSIFWSST